MIPVFLSSDENYAPMVSTTILSVMENTREWVDFFILDAGITKDSKEKIREVSKDHERCRVEYIEIDMKVFDAFSSPEGYLNKSSYARILIPELKPQLEKVIFSDVDVIFIGDIYEIYNESLDGKIIGAVPDAFYKVNDNLNNIYNRLELPRDAQYFYAGLILIDACKWRNEGVTDKLFTLSRTFGSRIIQADQDLLNIYFAKNYKELDVKYEVTNGYIKYRNMFDRKTQKAIDNPVIRHYEGPHKPWNSTTFGNHIMRDVDLFWRYARKTPFYHRLLAEFNRCMRDNVVR